MDIKTAIRWVKSNAGNYGIDPDKIGIWGHSSGGHLAALAAFSAGHPLFSTGTPELEKVHAVATLAAPVDLLSMGDWHDNPNSPESKFLGGMVQQQTEKAQQANPLTYLNGDIPTTLIIHGETDDICPVEQGRLLHLALEDSSYLEIKGADHDLVGGVLTMDEILILIQSFFTRNLKIGLPNKDSLEKHREEVKLAVNWFKENSK